MRWVLVALVVMSVPATASIWQDLVFFAPADPEPELPPGTTAENDGAFLCERAIQSAETRHRLPQDLLMQIGLTEAGHRGLVWPWTVNAEGKSHYFDSRTEAVRFVAKEEANGVKSIDVGCLQINRYWHRDAFPDLDAAFDPARNADYAARFLTQLRQEFGSWDKAVGAYHSRNPKRHATYQARVGDARNRARRLAERMSDTRLPLHMPDLNLLPALSADLDKVDVAAIALAATSPRSHRRAMRRPDPATRPKASTMRAGGSAQHTETASPVDDLPETGHEPRRALGHGLFATGGGALLPKKVDPLY